MTPTIEKLQIIRARCVELLEIADSRTPGKWEDDGTGSVWVDWHRVDPDTGYEGDHVTLGKFDPEDLAFVTACAGSAEAGWRSTIVMIDFVLNDPPVRGLHRWHAMAEAIIKVWEDLV